MVGHDGYKLKRKCLVGGSAGYQSVLLLCVFVVLCVWL